MTFDLGFSGGGEAVRTSVLILFGSFLISFLFIRTSARLMRSPKVPWWPGSVETEGGLHIHHLVFGIVLMLIGGTMGFALDESQSPWIELAAAAFGIGAGLDLRRVRPLGPPGGRLLVRRGTPVCGRRDRRDRVRRPGADRCLLRELRHGLSGAPRRRDRDPRDRHRVHSGLVLEVPAVTRNGGSACSRLSPGGPPSDWRSRTPRGRSGTTGSATRRSRPARRRATATAASTASRTASATPSAGGRRRLSSLPRTGQLGSATPEPEAFSPTPSAYTRTVRHAL